MPITIPISEFVILAFVPHMHMADNQFAMLSAESGEDRLAQVTSEEDSPLSPLTSETWQRKADLE